MTKASLPDRLMQWLVTAWHDRAISVKAVSFALVGVVNTLVDFGLFWLALKVVAVSPDMADDITVILANVFSWTIAVSGSFVMNTFITFGPESGRKLRFKNYVTFVASGVVGLVGNTAALAIVRQFLPVLVAKACAILVSFVINFSMSHFVVFRARHPRPGDAL